MIKYILLKVIRLYQKTISPEHGKIPIKLSPTCRFRPTCSEYSYQAIDKYGILKGVYLSIKRILKCNPFNHGGWDPLK